MLRVYLLGSFTLRGFLTNAVGSGLRELSPGRSHYATTLSHHLGLTRLQSHQGHRQVLILLILH